MKHAVDGFGYYRSEHRKLNPVARTRSNQSGLCGRKSVRVLAAVQVAPQPRRRVLELTYITALYLRHRYHRCFADGPPVAMNFVDVHSRAGIV